MCVQQLWDSTPLRVLTEAFASTVAGTKQTTRFQPVNWHEVVAVLKNQSQAPEEALVCQVALRRFHPSGPSRTSCQS